MAAIWRDGVSPTERSPTVKQGTLIAHLGMEFLEAGDDWFSGRMPVDERTMQPFGFLHGGASVAFAETLASWGGDCCVPATQTCMGMEINANHVRPATRGWVYGRATPENLGRTTQVWTVRITDGADKLVCVSRVTLAVVDIDRQPRGASDGRAESVPGPGAQQQRIGGDHAGDKVNVAAEGGHGPVVSGAG